jgi:ABC-type dipeptide/oligopeptide/nickel transport system permease component
MFLVSLATFGMMHLAPGDPIDILVGEAQITDEQIRLIQEKWGLDRPWYEQYMTWLGNVVQGDFGKSVVRTGVPVHEMVLDAAWPTLQLTVLALMTALLFAIPAGMIAAIKRYSLFDSIIMVMASAGVALPNFWVGLMLIYLFALQLGWLPSFGSGSPKNYVLPVLVLAINEMAILATTARAKGLAERFVIVRHAVRNAMLPVITVIGIRAAFLLSGTIVVETIFAWPGIGRLFISSIDRLDYQVVQAIVLLFSFLVVTANIVTDLAYSFIDPRIRLK